VVIGRHRDRRLGVRISVPPATYPPSACSCLRSQAQVPYQQQEPTRDDLASCTSGPGHHRVLRGYASSTTTRERLSRAVHASPATKNASASMREPSAITAAATGASWPRSTIARETPNDSYSVCSTTRGPLVVLATPPEVTRGDAVDDGCLPPALKGATSNCRTQALKGMSRGGRLRPPVHGQA
jgi:hypothetical protein